MSEATTTEKTYAENWAEAINETYGSEGEAAYIMDAACDADEDYAAAEKRILTKAARILRGHDESATFTGAELDVVRHLMPAHEVHQSGAMRWMLDFYGPPEEEQPS